MTVGLIDGSTYADPSTADELRTTEGVRFVADAKPGYPCRQCLSDAEIGESLVLVAHDPFTVDSPYRSRSRSFFTKSLAHRSSTSPTFRTSSPDASSPCGRSIVTR
jgi:hypothetical protein